MVLRDTILTQPAADGRSWRHNSWSYTSDENSADGITEFQEALDGAGAPMEFFPQTEEERQFNDIHFVDGCTVEPCGARWAVWPAVAVMDKVRDRALIFYHLIYAEPGDFNFEGVGSSVALWESFDSPPTRPVFDTAIEHPTLLFPKPLPSFGSAALVVEDFLYLYGCQTEELSKPCYLARVTLADVLEPEAWLFMGKDDWTDDVSQAISIFQGNDMMTMAWNASVGAYVAIYSQPMDTKVMMRTAAHPAGPWSKAVKVFSTQKPDGGEWTYDALAHPELEREDGRVQVITYSRTTGFLQGEVRVVELEIRPVD